MNQKNNLHSSLTVLVAKLYKAERLYSGIKFTNTSADSSNDCSAVSSSTVSSLGSSLLTEYSNEVRSNEWHKIHREYRIKLNKLTTDTASSSLLFHFENLRELFLAEFENAEFDLYEAKGLAREAIEKEEFTHLLKLSAEILRRKSRLQAMKVIYDELESLAAVAKNKKSSQVKTDMWSKARITQSENNSQSAKVVPLMRKASF